ncbi:hypothetical protein GF389_03245 [Candidatus Dojkabacteria bacterium]|nr:hypothetical protein [Candidatus Dojkabacteria bacterium]
MATKKKVALSFRGGGARRTAYVGVLQALEEEGIKIDGFIGASAGAMVGAAYSLGKTPDEILDYAREFYVRKLMNYKIWKQPFSIVDENKFQNYVNNFLGDQDIKDCEIETFIELTNYKTGKQIIVDRGPVDLLLTATSAAPMFMRPVTVNGELCFDGDLDHSMHTKFLRQRGYDIVLAFMADKDVSVESSNLVKTIHTLEDKVTEIELEYEPPDFLLRNIGGGANFMDFRSIEEPYNIAYEKTKASMNQIKALLDS